MIDKVHSDGKLPRIQANTNATLNVNGEFSIDENNRPVRIVINPNGPYPELTCLHEIGHFIDHQAIDQVGFMASGASPLLQGWWDAITRSEAIRTLARRQLETLAVVTLANGVSVRLFVEKELVEYLLRPDEIFARSYAQFIATMSKDQILSSQLANVLSSQEWKVYPTQWKEDDFLPILESLRHLFRQKGWME